MGSEPNSGEKLRIAMIGTRGVPAAYGGFETAVEEIGRRLVDRGHHVTVYCRAVDRPKKSHHLGMRLVHLPAIRSKIAETLSHTALSVAHVLTHRRPDVAFVFNAANAPFVPALRLRGIPNAVHVDGLEWKRTKWGGAARKYYRFSEQFAVKHSDALIADAQGIADYYQDEFDVPTTVLTYGATILKDVKTDRLSELELLPGGFHLVVARFEPENHVDVILEGYRRSKSSLPLIVVGSAPYSADYTEKIAAIAASDSRIRLLGGVWDQTQLDQLYVHAKTYLHGHSVGGTNPSLLRAMGAGTPVIAFDVSFNREVLGEAGAYFTDPESISRQVDSAEATDSLPLVGERLQDRAQANYDWDHVTVGYEALASRLSNGQTSRGLGRRRSHSRRANPRSTAVVHSPARRLPTPESN